MERGNVMSPIQYRDIPISYRNNIIPLHMFLKDKYLSTGEYDKTKARLVADGSRQDIAEVGDAASPTVNPISVNVSLNYAASNKSYLISAHDCKHAFLLNSRK
jgi:hypothetical protein